MSTAALQFPAAAMAAMVPLQLHRDHQMKALIPDWHDSHRATLRDYIEPFLERHESLAPNRQQTRHDIVSSVQVDARPRPEGPLVFAFDVDGTKLDCYTTSSDVGHAFIGTVAEQLAKKSGGSASELVDRLHTATRRIEPEYLC
ncbi:MAG: hypothetical protein M3N08_06635, partial [Pseudomonadota bacterium]|nr:hypothetical protein [Pseudomonadota bacterium]